MDALCHGVIQLNSVTLSDDTVLHCQMNTGEFCHTVDTDVLRQTVRWIFLYPVKHSDEGVLCHTVRWILVYSVMTVLQSKPESE